MRVTLAISSGLVFLAAANPQRIPNSFPSKGKIHRLDPKIDGLLERDAHIEVLGSGITWCEGPVWVSKAKGWDGDYLLFSDIPRNSVMKWDPANSVVSLFLKPSGYTGVVDYGAEPGSNGLLLDAKGRLILMQHGDRRVARLEKDGGMVTLADRYQGKRLNSPNDGTLHSSGAIYFTDPPYGLPKHEKDPRRELQHFGAYRIGPDGALSLLTTEMTRPNGITLSPDEKTLYVANSDPDKALWMAFAVDSNGSIGKGRVFADVTSAVRAGLAGLPDGLKTDVNGNLWASGPGGIYIFAPDGKQLGRIETGERTANCAWGNDGSVLYMATDMMITRIRTKTKGARW